MHKMERYAKIVNAFSTKRFILNVWQGSEYAFASSSRKSSTSDNALKKKISNSRTTGWSQVCGEEVFS